MPSTRTARRIAAATALSAVTFCGLTGLAAAETPPFQPGIEIVAVPEPTIPPPDPAPEADLPLADPCGQLPQGCEQPEPDPEPPAGPGDLADPCGQTEEGCPQPEPDPEVNGADDLTDDPCNHQSHGCGEDEEVDDFTANPVDPAGPVDPVDPADPEVDDGDKGGGALPRTGIAFASLLGLGTALVGAGAAAKRAARR